MSDTHADLEAALMAWSERLAEKDRVLSLLEQNLVAWSESLAKLARVLDEIRSLQHGEPIAATGSRPQLRLVKKGEE